MKENAKNIYPPKLAERIFKKLFFDYGHFTLNGDVEEEYRLIFKNKGSVAAKFWYFWQVFRALLTVKVNSTIWGGIMFRNYFKITLRNVKRNKTISFINIFGLVLSLVICLYIYLYVSHELSYDNYHKDGDRIYRIIQVREAETAVNEYAAVSGNVAPLLKEDFPEVENAGRVWRRGSRPVKIENKTYVERNVVAVDPDILNIFTIPVIKGDKITPLDDPAGLLISETLARKYFGENDPIGKSVNIDERDYKITGIIKDPVKNTHIKMNIIMSFKPFENQNWIRNWTLIVFYTYLKLRDGTNIKEFDDKMLHFAENYIKSYLERSNQKYKYLLQPVKGIHLDSHLQFETERPGNRMYVYIFSVAGFLILAISGLNYMNIMNAKAISRARETLVRKVAGAKQNQITRQLISETLIIFGISLLISIVFLYLLLPTFNNIIETSLSFNGLINLKSFLIISIVVLLTAVGGGIVPASIIASFKPVNILKHTSSKFSSGSAVKKMIVFVQFSITLILIIATLMVYKQINFMKTSDLGFKKNQKFIIEAQGRNNLPSDYKLIKSELRKIPDVTGVAVSHRVPGNSLNTLHVRLLEDATKGYEMPVIFCDFDFITDYGLKMAAGRAFNREIQTDINGAFIINESAVREFGYDNSKEMLGKKMFLGNSHRNKIIGVIKDFHYQGLQSNIRSLVMEVYPNLFNKITVSISSENIPNVLSKIEDKMKELAPETNFRYSFLDDLFNEQYKQEETVSLLVLFFTLFGIFIACLGLFGLVLLITQNRTKEIGIRKVLGASSLNIINNISREFVILFILTNIFAWPVSYLIINKWLENFVNRTDISLFIFILAGLSLLLIAGFTICLQTIKASKKNPVDSLRYE